MCVPRHWPGVLRARRSDVLRMLDGRERLVRPRDVSSLVCAGPVLTYRLMQAGHGRSASAGLRASGSAAAAAGASGTDAVSGHT